LLLPAGNQDCTRRNEKMRECLVSWHILALSVMTRCSLVGV
jgi:hypothetical protein